MNSLQTEHKEWVQKKYPDQPPKVPAVGCLEEAGELVHAILKIEQIQTWGEDERHKLANLRVKLVDAVGDCGIYACSLCNANEWNFEEVWRDSVLMFESEYIPTLDIAIELVRLATYLAVSYADINNLHAYLSQLKTVAARLGLDAEAAIRSTWETVKCR